MRRLVYIRYNFNHFGILAQSLNFYPDKKTAVADYDWFQKGLPLEYTCPDVPVDVKYLCSAQIN